MAKKKQFAGKKTKLAKLPLTQVLAQQSEDAASLSPRPDAPESGGQPPRSLPEGSPGVAGYLAAAYFQLILDLTALKSHLANTAGAAFQVEPTLPTALPPLPLLVQTLLAARQELRDLRHFLSPA